MRYPQRLVDPCEVVPHERDVQKMDVVGHFLGMRIGQSGEASIHHTDGEIHSLSIAGRKVLSIRIAHNLMGPSPAALSRAITGCRAFLWRGGLQQGERDADSLPARLSTSKVTSRRSLP